MQLRKVLALRGPNIWTNFPMLEAWVELGDLKDSDSNAPSHLQDRLVEWLPSLRDRLGSGEGSVGGAGWAGLLALVTQELQMLTGPEVGPSRVVAMETAGVYQVLLPYREETLARECLVTAHRFCLAALNNQPIEAGAEVKQLRSMALEVCLGPSTAAIVEAALHRGIPARRIGEGSLVQLGQGARRRRIWASETERTGAIGESIAQDKELTRRLLSMVGVPVADGRPVTDAEDAWAAAQEIGLPVVVKPRDGNHGRGVATDLRTCDQVLAAFAVAREQGAEVLVERYAPGADHRVLVISGRVVAASRREPAQVRGDGQSTIAQLVAEVNRDPRRGEGHTTALSQIKLDATALAVLAEQGHSPDSIPVRGEWVLIRRNANLSTGGTASDVTDAIHPEVAARAIDAARAIGLDVAGIDLVAEDIGRPLEDQGGIVVEVNACPGLRMHLEPSSGHPRPVGQAIVDSLFPPGDNGRIPIVAVTGVNGKTTTTRLAAHLLGQSGQVVGMTCTDGIYVGHRRIDAGDCSGPQSARTILMNPAVEAAVLETARGGILREGLAFDRCDVAVVTNIGQGDHLGIGGITTREQLARVKRAVVDALAPTGTAVLNAADPLVVEMAARCPGSVIFFARDPETPALARHRAEGGRAVFVRQSAIVLAEGDSEEPLIELERVPLTLGGRINFQVENALAATASAWALDLPADLIHAGLASFASDPKRAPGRFNVMKAGGATIVLDYGHNPSAIDALIEAITAFPHSHRTILYSAAGDRRDADIIRQGELLGRAFDRAVLYEDGDNRGRADGEVSGLLRRGLESGKRVREVLESRGEQATIETAFQALNPGDLLVIQVDDVDKSLELVHRLVAERIARFEPESFDEDQPHCGDEIFASPELESPQPDVQDWGSLISQRTT